MKTIFFDLDNTLYLRTDPFAQACRIYFDMEKEEAIRIFSHIEKRGKEAALFYKQGKLDNKGMFIYRYQKGFEDGGIHLSEQETEDFIAIDQYQLDHMTLSEDTAELLYICKDLFDNIGIITNGPSDIQRKKIKSLNLEKWVNPELIIISSEVNIAKPDPGIFLLAQAKTEKEPSDLIMVGDSYENDILPANRLNWLTVYLSSDDGNKATLNISSIKQLSEILLNYSASGHNFWL